MTRGESDRLVDSFLRCKRSVGSRGNQIAIIRRDVVIVRLPEKSIVAVPFHFPMPQLSVPIAQQSHIESRGPPIVGWRHGGMDQPARFGGTCLRLCAYAKKNWRYTFLRSGERKATARRQVERFERTRNL